MNSMEQETLAHRLGMTVHVSALLMKAGRLGFAAPEDLERLAIARGLRYYSNPSEVAMVREESAIYRVGDLSNEELAMALLSICLPYSQQRIRMGAAMLAAEGNSPEVIAQLAVMERGERVVHYLASLGRQVEPENEFWSEILVRLPEFDPLKPDLLPHLTRFVAMTGYTQRGRETVMQWIRPQAAFVA